MPRKPHNQSAAGFTILEILVVVGIIITLIAILIPAVGYVKASSKKASTTALLNSIATGIEQYFSNFNTYPPSRPAIAANSNTFRTNIELRNGGLMLAQALTGYLPGNSDGAGKDTASTAWDNDPALGFRTRAGAQGQIYGPYTETGGASWKIDPANPNHQFFVDLWGNQILYYRAAPTITNGIRQNPLTIFAPQSAFDGIFVIDHNAEAYTDKGSGPIWTDITPPPPPPVPPSPTHPDFLKLIATPHNPASPNTLTNQTVLGRNSYLLISAGPDGIHFTADDIIHSGK